MSRSLSVKVKRWLLSFTLKLLVELLNLRVDDRLNLVRLVVLPVVGILLSIVDFVVKFKLVVVNVFIYWTDSTHHLFYLFNQFLKFLTFNHILFNQVIFSILSLQELLKRFKISSVLIGKKMHKIGNDRRLFVIEQHIVPFNSLVNKFRVWDEVTLSCLELS